MIDWTSILGTLVGFVGGGGLTYFFYFREHKLKAGAEANKATAEAEKTLIDNYETILDRMGKIVEDADVRYNKMDSFHTQRYDELQKRMLDNSEQIKELREKLNSSKKFTCLDLSCRNRQAKTAKTNESN